MTRQSDKTDRDVHKLIKANNLTRLSGFHESNSSVHEVRCNACGMLMPKKSYSFTQGKGGCLFIPCWRKGRLSLQYVTNVAKEHGVDSVGHFDMEKVPLDELQIKATDTLIFTKSNMVMTQTWQQVRERALSAKQCQFFISDDKRRRPIKKLTLSQVSKICGLANLIPPLSVPNKQRRALYTHAPCGSEVPLTYIQLESWKESKCETCHPFEARQMKAFNDFLLEKRLMFAGKLSLKKNSNEVERQSRCEVQCLECGNINEPRAFGSIRYRGFAFCDNASCKNTYPPLDKANQNIDYYITLYTDNSVASLEHSQRLFPRSAFYIKRAKHKGEVGGMEKEIKKRLGWRRNSKTQCFTEVEIKTAFESALKNGASGIEEILKSITTSMKNFINRQMSQSNQMHHKILDELNVSFKKTIDIANKTEAIEFIESNDCRAWSDIVCRHPRAGEQIKQLGIKNDVFEHYQWEHKMFYHDKSDEKLIQEALRIVEANQIDCVQAIANISYGLMRNIRDRGLVSQLCKKAGINETQNWVNHSYESTKSFIEQAGIISPTDLHGVHAGLYKHASKQGWLDMLKKDFGWGKYIGLDGDVYDSIPEMIVANLLHILSIPYVQQPPYTHFRGMKGGVMRADFLLDDAYWIEVWGFAKESRENYIFKDYSEKREYKEYNCKVSNLELIGIDGFKYYHGKYKGVSRFTEYALNKLSVAIGVAPAIDTIVSQLRTSVALAAAGLSVGGSKAAKK